MKHPSFSFAKDDYDFRTASRRDDANLLWAAFPGPSQQAVARRGSRKLGVSDRTVINWLSLTHDMPSWAVKAAKAYVRGVERLATRIEGP